MKNRHSKAEPKRDSKLKRGLIMAGLAAGLAGFTYLASSAERRQRTAVSAIRQIFNTYGKLENHRFAQYIPDDVSVLRDVNYDHNDPQAHLDVYYPASHNSWHKLAPIVWVHGGGWIAGDKNSKEPWGKILAHYTGCAVVMVNYTIAPQDTYPLPVKQVNTALAYINRKHRRLGLNRNRIILGGDSAGAQIAAQVALINTNYPYATAMGIAPAVKKYQLAGTVLLCGAYDLRLAADDADMAKVMQVFVKAYSGRLDFENHPLIQYASIPEYITADFPPTFITDGNYDPLLPHSMVLTKALRDTKVSVDPLFFSRDYRPLLLHEYQFNLNTEAGQLCFERILKFVAAHIK